jgi:predicted CoA-binding protein
MSQNEALDLLSTAKTIAIVGVSDKTDRPSNQVARYLLENSDYTVYFVNPLIKELFGQEVFASLADIPVKIDIVDVFRRIEDMPEILEESIEIGAGAFWMQLGLRDEVLAEVARSAGLTVIQDKCLKIEHQKL